MTREEAYDKSGIMLAYADGKEIQFFKKDRPDLGWTTIDNPVFDFERNNYRIKPEPTYRPFKDAEECWQEMQKHQPFGWVKLNETSVDGILFVNLTKVRVDSIETEQARYYFDHARNTFTFADGEPFGVKEETV